jgi:hypothetical protein
MSDEIYSVRVLTWHGEEVLRISGRRDTVIEAALRVILDYAPAWNLAQAATPQFRIAIYGVSR